MCGEMLQIQRGQSDPEDLVGLTVWKRKATTGSSMGESEVDATTEWSLTKMISVGIASPDGLEARAQHTVGMKQRATETDAIVMTERTEIWGAMTKEKRDGNETEIDTIGNQIEIGTETVIGAGRVILIGETVADESLSLTSFWRYSGRVICTVEKRQDLVIP